MLIKTVESYLKLRRATGFDLKYDGKVLQRFSQFAANRGEKQVHAQTAMEWAKLAATPGERSRRLKAVIRFARYAKAEDDSHEVPPDGVFGYHKKRRVPFIFSPTDVCKIVEQAMRLGPLGSLRPHVFASLFALLSATGMRVSEALALRKEGNDDTYRPPHYCIPARTLADRARSQRTYVQLLCICVPVAV